MSSRAWAQVSAFAQPAGRQVSAMAGAPGSLVIRLHANIRRQVGHEQRDSLFRRGSLSEQFRVAGGADAVWRAALEDERKIWLPEIARPWWRDGREEVQGAV